MAGKVCIETESENYIDPLEAITSYVSSKWVIETTLWMLGDVIKIFNSITILLFSIIVTSNVIWLFKIKMKYYYFNLLNRTCQIHLKNKWIRSQEKAEGVIT